MLNSYYTGKVLGLQEVEIKNIEERYEILIEQPLKYSPRWFLTEFFYQEIGKGGHLIEGVQKGNVLLKASRIHGHDVKRRCVTACARYKNASCFIKSACLSKGKYGKFSISP